tara:strand:- start:206 stop:409 length:204 start_codon:yes stop_codon:yes gene_type:complete
MKVFGYIIEHIKSTDTNEPYWSNTNHGNRHQRIFSLEKVVAPDGLIAFALFVGKHQVRWAKITPKFD